MNQALALRLHRKGWLSLVQLLVVAAATGELPGNPGKRAGPGSTRPLNRIAVYETVNPGSADSNVARSRRPEETEALWVFFRDKPARAGGGRISWAAPQQLRNSQHLDEPLDPSYLAQIESAGFRVRTRSRWFNAVTLSATRGEAQRLHGLSFVREVRPVRRRSRSPLPDGEPISVEAPSAKGLAPPDNYGPSFEQVARVGGTALHNLGFRGEGVTIALLDAGFNYRDQRAFAHLRVKAVWDFVNGDGDVSDQAGQPVTGDELVNGQNLHGTRVLSVLAGFDPGSLVGVAPEADYILAKTEDITSELPVEEDHWIAGLEWADSLGADIVNSSLGYRTWDDGSGYTYEDLDGQTALTTVAAELAVARGIVIVSAAGNEGNTPMHFVDAPADARGVIAVGATSLTDNRIAKTSSHGLTVDNRIKPDVVAPGQGVVAASGSSATADLRDSFTVSKYMRVSGTSFATPLVSGVSALLLQIHPDWGPREVADALRQSARDLGEAGPDTLYGWGLVDAIAASGLEVEQPEESVSGLPFPNPALVGGAVGSVIYFPLQLSVMGEVSVRIFDLSGALVEEAINLSLEPGDYRSDRALPWKVPDTLNGGIYIYRLESTGLARTGKIAVIRSR